MKTNLADIPSVERILQFPHIKECITNFGRPLVLGEIRIVLDTIRKNAEKGCEIPENDELIRQLDASLQEIENKSTRPVINATGVILHTNLGRAPLSQSAISAMQESSAGYSSLEFDILTGSRRKRTEPAEYLLKKLLGIDEALIVNNNASAVMLVLSALASNRKVVIARSQIVEIGGGFRLPDILKQSGAHLIEIGTTNQIRLTDYENGIREGGKLILRTHPSNFKIIGYTGEPKLTEICKLASSLKIPVVDDLGSGAILDTTKFGLAHEPMVQESLMAGADVVCFSGDKLLGGPQSGIIVGKKEYLGKIKKHPLARALRADKVLLSGLEATLKEYLKDKAEERIPVWKMISEKENSLKKRAEAWSEKIGFGMVISGKSTIGGGSLPEETLPTWLFSLQVKHPDAFLKKLRYSTLPILARIQNDLIVFDPRTVLEEQDEVLVSSIIKILQETRENYEKRT
ncbi:L-seryl-tRNA(Sec) selenium transferase [Leptolinea tardivitalis]|uniref:L-seryl-tRNA(Sec) selenium transferase n=1 Tax=Leptolinea tardivitalis TaxID=229920 RepID=A0A0P6WR86_9CHLR|nr:L-seryl-tRNA(Sec) selenium transferase [Leptolinea tardivitalis]KPL72584.1 selenocysteine synthase [Leptolinea tardivitalis]GAP21110.1 L-seryl-tRNA(Sec) selenium transferase [Leptolinea tardivitalis]